MANGEQKSLRSVTLADWRVEGLHHTLSAGINKDGDLVIDGCDSGSNVEEMWGDDDYEYAWTVPASYKDSVLLLLLRDRFAGSKHWTEDDSQFRDWLTVHQIPATFWCYI